MKAWKMSAPLILVALGLNLAQSKPKKPDVPAVFQNAKYVYVQAADGDILKPGLFPEDRQAISDVQDSLRQWNRYAIALSPSQADLVFVIRKGRAAAAQAHVGISDGSRSQPGPAQAPGQFPTQGRGTEAGVRSEVGEPDDMLRVYIPNEGKLTSIVWDRTMEGGLDAPSVQLVRQLKAAVEKAYPPSATTTKKP
jgi:hypothetical protein